MRVTRLKLANVGPIEMAEFLFRPDFNLVVGVNGVGKTTVLDTLAVCLYEFLRRANGLRSYSMVVGQSDIRMGADALDVLCEVEVGVKNSRYSYALHKSRESTVPREEKAGMPREQVHDTPDRATFVGDPPAAVSGDEPSGRPFAILFTTIRAVPQRKSPPKSAAAGGIKAAFSDALLKHRWLHLAEFGAWMQVQETLSSERPEAKRVLDALDKAVARFLPGYRYLRLGGESESGNTLLIDRGSATLSVRQLSDGERGVLAMVLDLTRRLAQANPQMNDPAAEAEAVVLIDEIELHLHPGWQRRIVRHLIKTFPKCQFIATTHSPQVIGEVEHDRIHIMADGEVYSPAYSFGVDSSRVLEEIMGTDPRTRKVKDLLSEISRTIGDDRYDDVRALLADLAKHLGEDDPEVTRIRTLLDFMTGDA